MSEPRGQQKPETSGGISEALNRKMGPFPVWLYLVVVGLVVFLFIYLRRQNASQDASVTDTGTVSGKTLPPFINQVYTNTTPPEQSSPDPKSRSHIIKLKSAASLTLIAKRWDMTKDQLIRLNPQLANKYENTGKRVPKGTRIRVLSGDPDEGKGKD